MNEDEVPGCIIAIVIIAAIAVFWAWADHQCHVKGGVLISHHCIKKEALYE